MIPNPDTAAPPAPAPGAMAGPRLSDDRQRRVAGLIVAALLLSTITFTLAALPLAAILLLAWDRWGPLPKPAGYALLAFLGFGLLTAPFASDARLHLAGLASTYGLWIAYWRIVAGLPPSPRTQGLIWRGVTASGVVLALIGLANMAGAGFLLRFGELPWAPGTWLLDLNWSTAFQRASGFSMNPNILAALLVLIWPVTLRLAADSAGRARWGWTAALTLQWAGMLATQSRGAVVASVAVALTWLWRDGTVRRPMLRSLAVLAAGLVVSLPAWAPLIDRLETIGDPDHHSNRIRIALVRSGWDMVREHPLAGIGLWNYDKEYPRYQYPEDTANCPHLHNWYLQVAAESGLPAAMLLFAGIGLIGWRARRQGSVVAEATLAFAIFSVTDYLFHDARVALVAWTLWGMAAGGRDDSAAMGPSQT